MITVGLLSVGLNTYVENASHLYVSPATSPNCTSRSFPYARVRCPAIPRCSQSSGAIVNSDQLFTKDNAAENVAKAY